MPAELAPLRRPLALRRADGAGRFTGACGAVEVVAVLAGVGMSAAARATERVLEAGQVDHVLVVGIAGGIGAGVSIGDLVVPERVLDVATGAEHRPTPIGDVLPRGMLATADGGLFDPRAIARLAARGAVAIDMETAAVAAVCERRGCPWSVFRAISDRAGDGSTDAAILALLGPEGRPNPAAVARLLLTRPQRIPQLVRLAWGTRRAAGTAASAAVRVLGSVFPGSPV